MRLLSTRDGSGACRAPGRGAALAAALLAVVATGTAGAAGPAGGSGPGASRTVHDTRGSAAVGALFGGAVRAGGHYCTAAAVDSPGGDLIVTAAHCLGGGAAGRSFVPGYHDGVAPYGVWRITAVTVAPAWQERRDEDADVAFAEVAPVHGRRLADVVGGFAPGHGGPVAEPVRLTGYPSSAEAPLTCENRVTSAAGTQLRIVCAGYSGGTSGSPWVTARGTVAGVIGGHEEGGNTPDVSYSPVFGPAVAAQYRAAVAAERPRP